MRLRFWVVIPTALGCSANLSPAERAIDLDGLALGIETLASDAFEGRGPSSPGEERTVRYLEDAFAARGLRGANAGSFVQPVPLVEATVQGSPSLNVRGAARAEWTFGEDWVGWTKRAEPEVGVRNAPLVFVGYGIVAPEYGWDDYAAVDVRGRTVLILVNDPGYATQDTAWFNGNAMTYYGRWTYKFEEAARQGAAAALVVHQTGPAGYPWEVVQGSWMGPQFALERSENAPTRVAVEGWVTEAAVRSLLTATGQDFGALVGRAAEPGFRAVPLNLRATTTLTSTVERSTSRNVAAVLAGRDRADEYVVYMAHWDHFGRNPELDGDQIYNGAFDNATGTAGLLELADAFTALTTPPARSIMFLAVTAEEQGLLGSAYYAQNPLVPTAQTVAAINLDGLNNFGPMRDITVVGYGNSGLDDYLETAATAVDRVVRADPEPEKGYFYRSDHFNFAKVGIPSLYIDGGIDHVEHGEAWTLERRAEYVAERYHKPSDEWDPAWDLRGAVDDLRLVFNVGLRIANETSYPNWQEGNEFRAVRDADRAAAAQRRME